ncbi:hypothetical protein C0995_015530 [Termitomyces sp. Mi166|nr:hypothetical protein C0995_015530 [Termitomyces sp. Mi166\
MADQGLVSFSSSAIPPAPSFADFRFSTIGQEPPLLKRISIQSPDLHHNGSPCPSSPTPGELEYPSTIEPPRPLSRPTLFQSLAYSNPSGADAMVPINTRPASESADVRETCSAELSLLHLQTPSSSQHTRSISSAVSAPLDVMAHGVPTSSSPASSSSHKEHASMSISPPEMARIPGIHTVPTTKHQTALPTTTMHETHSSYAALRALQARLVASLSKLHPPDMTDALLRVQSANSHSVNALTTAHCSHILAQQSLATAQEAVAASQECLNAAELARKHVNDALTTIRQFHSGKAGFDAEGNADWQWKVNYIQLQDDLRMLGKWVVEKENEGAKNRDVDRQDTAAGDKKLAESVKCVMEASGFDSHVVQGMGSEASQQADVMKTRRSTAASRVTPHPDLPSNRNLDYRRSLELEADVATKARSSERNHISNGLPMVTTDIVPMEVQLNLVEHLPPKVNGVVQEARQPAQSTEAPCSSTQNHEESIVHLSEDQVRSQVQYEEARLRELHAFQIMQQERVTSEGLSDSALNGSRLSPQTNPAANESIDKLQPPQSKSSAIVENNKRALQVHRDQEAKLAEKPEQKRIETRRLLEERKQRELAELKKKEEDQLNAAKEQELLVEQERRRQEVMVQKQRATAETAARINAERARERERAMGASLQSSISSTPQPPLPDRLVDSGNPVAKKTATSKAIKKPKSLSGGIKLGSTADGQSQSIATSDSLPPSPTLARSAVLGTRLLKAKAPVNAGLEVTKAGNVSSRKAIPVEKSSQNLPMIASQTPTPTNGMNEAEDLHVYRHSDDPGNLCVVPLSQVAPASPEAQAANLRFVKDVTGVRWDPSTLPNLKAEPEHMGQLSLHRHSPVVSVKKESPIPVPLVGSQTRPSIEPEPFKCVDSSPDCSSLANSYPLPSLSSIKTHHTSDKDASMDGITRTKEGAPVSLTIVPPFVNGIDIPSAATPFIAYSHSNIKPPNPHRDNLSPQNTSKPLLTSKYLNAPLKTSLLTLDMTPIDPNLPDDTTQIAPVIHANGGWDRPVDEEIYSGESRMRELTPPQHSRQLRRGGDHYSPPPRALTPDPYTSRGYAARSASPIARSPLSPAQRPPVLGKRRQCEDVREDEHPTRRQWPADGTRRTRSPPPHLRHSTQWRSGSPDRPAFQARMQVTDHPNMSRARLPQTRELAWRSPSPDRPALQARIGVRDPVVCAINGGQSYRPTYSLDTYERSQSRIRDSYQSRQVAQSVPAHRLAAEPEPRGPSYNRGRGSMNSNRASPRGRGNRGGNRPLNLEQRISSFTNTKPLTLINRLESPPRN